jgi:hypothetical protein
MESYHAVNRQVYQRCHLTPAEKRAEESEFKSDIGVDQQGHIYNVAYQGRWETFE